MRRWLSGMRGAIVMIVTWTVGWGVGFGGLMEAFVDPRGELVDIWPAVMGFFGFLGGVVIAALLRMRAGRRGLHDVSLASFGTLGAVAGLALGVLAVGIGLPDDIAIDTPARRPIAPAVLMGITLVLGAVAGIGSGVFVRLVARWQAPAVAGR